MTSLALWHGAGAAMVFNNLKKGISMNKKHNMIAAALFLTLQITASPLNELLKQMNVTEELLTAPTSVGAIVYSYRTFPIFKTIHQRLISGLILTCPGRRSCFWRSFRV